MLIVIEESFNLPMLDHPGALWQTGIMINEAIHIAQLQSKPVHINFPFREPLYETVTKSNKKVRKVDHYKVDKSLNKTNIKELSLIWNSHSKKMIISLQIKNFLKQN